jgi:hypothetical protein
MTTLSIDSVVIFAHLARFVNDRFGQNFAGRRNFLSSFNAAREGLRYNARGVARTRASIFGVRYCARVANGRRSVPVANQDATVNVRYICAWRDIRNDKSKNEGVNQNAKNYTVLVV